MKARELGNALEGRGYIVTFGATPEGDDQLTVSRPGEPGIPDQVIQVTGGVAYWPWGAPIPGQSAEGAALAINEVMSVSLDQFRNST